MFATSELEIDAKSAACWQAAKLMVIIWHGTKALHLS